MLQKPKFVCQYGLDERPDLELVNLNQEAYRLIQKTLEPKYFFRVNAEGLPDPVELWLVYFAVLIYGAADATLTLVLHNLGREARFQQRQVFEYISRATFYSENPEEARLEILSEPLREQELLDGLGYDKSSPRYLNVLRMVAETKKKYQDAYQHGLRRTPSLRQMLGPQLNDDISNFYSLHYRLHSQAPHGTVLGIRGIFGDADRSAGRIPVENITFDSREPNPNLTLEAVTAYVLYYLQLMSKHLNISSGPKVDDLKRRFSAVQARLWGPVLGQGRAHENFQAIIQKISESKLAIEHQSELTAIIRGKQTSLGRIVYRLLNVKTADGDFRLILEASIQPQPGKQAPSPTSTDVSSLTVDTVVKMISMSIEDRIRNAIQLIRREGRDEGYAWFTADGKGYMVSSTIPVDKPGYVVRLRPGATDEELVSEAVASSLIVE